MAIKIEDLGLRKIGNTLQLVGLIYQGEGSDYIMYLPGETPATDDDFGARHRLIVEDWEAFLRQSDQMETEVLERSKDGKVTKAFVRKSTRQIEQGVSWTVYRRDGYKCRYCGADDIPLTVDHLVTWESGGPTTVENLVASCRKCNRTRSDLPYAEWLEHPYYLKVSRGLSPGERHQNKFDLEGLAKIPLRVGKRKR